MMRSMYAGVAGLRVHQTKMDVIGNNIANVNTVGFKKSRVNFQEMLNQTLRGASAPQGNRGGTNPMQIGLGVQIGSIDVIHASGSPQSTGRNLDMSIEGEGYFVLGEGSDRYYTRAGFFDFDTDYNMHLNGLKVQGWVANDQFVLDSTGAPGSINLSKIAESSVQKATENLQLGRNLDSTSEIGFTHPTPTKIYDSQGQTHDLNITYEKTAENEWTVTVATGLTPPVTVALEFDTNGRLNINGPGLTDGKFGVIYDAGVGVDNIDFDIDFSALTQVATETSALALGQDGFEPGSLQSISVDISGTIVGTFSNGENLKLAQVALATFRNPAGLAKDGSTLFRESRNSGIPQVDVPGSAGKGIVKPETLEMSNVDLSQEFVDMITTQRGFQANSRIITTSDELLQELVNLKR